MFTKRITESDEFLGMPSSSQMLYFHLSMNADDDGFVSNPRKIQRMCGASNDDYDLLIMKRFILTFESGVRWTKKVIRYRRKKVRIIKNSLQQ